MESSQPRSAFLSSEGTPRPGAAPPSISVVIPVYNSEHTLPDLVARLHPVLSGLASTYELVLVNDCSRDRSWNAIENATQRHTWVRGINLMRNYGQHNALLAGIRAARFAIVVTMDDDLQNPPEEVPTLLKQLASGYDVVYGTPDKEQHGLWRNLASRLTKRVLRSAMGVDTAQNVSAFRAFRLELRNAFADYRNSFVSIDVLLTWGTTSFTAVPVRHAPRRVGTSNYTFRKMIIHAANMITGFTTLPLQLASWAGFALTAFGIAVLIFVVGRYLALGDSVPGFPFLASLIAIFSGAQLFSLGIIGEYLARMHVHSLEQPAYVVRSLSGSTTTNTGPSEQARNE